MPIFKPNQNKLEKDAFLTNFATRGVGATIVRSPIVKNFLRNNITRIGGMFFEQNEKTSNSVGVRYNRFVLSDKFKVLKRNQRNFDPSISDRMLSANFPTNPNTNYSLSKSASETPSFDRNTRKRVLLSSKFRGFDFARQEPDLQLFFTNLIQRNFMQFSSDGADNTNFGNITDLNSYTSMIGVDKMTDPKSRGKDFLQSFFHFDLSVGDFALVAGDHVRSARLRLIIQSHFGERTFPSMSYHSCSSLSGPLKVNRRKFQYATVSKPFTANYIQGAEGDRFLYNQTDGWDSYYGTGKTDIVESTIKEFIIDKPMKNGEELYIDVKDIVQDAIDNRSSIVRIVLRPKQDIYDRLTQDTNPKNGVGNHWFEFYRDPDLPELLPSLDVKITPNKDSTPQRRARFLR
jgi:hypothetical protein